jgi:hypothetical protein
MYILIVGILNWHSFQGAYMLFIGIRYMSFIGIKYTLFIGIKYTLFIGIKYTLFIGIKYMLFIGIKYAVRLQGAAGARLLDCHVYCLLES